MMHLVFVNDKPLRFVSIYEGEKWKTSSGDFISEKDLTVEQAIAELENNKNHHGIIYLCESPDVMWQIFISHCELIEAAGGLVMNEKNNFLFIFRYGKWDLPKGKIEFDETPEVAAVREVKEECGLQKVELIRPLQKTFHTYHLHGKRKLKKTHWFFMNAHSTEKLIPQTEEDILKIEWMSLQRISEDVFKNTYASVSELLKNFFEMKN
jgi:8-oxo-dGTP pyrophosphatase MutT (NUDIX family)